ncbi:hypothetical protein C1H46_030966 [Malus baccata]|uniref:Uncharacterized protein n=1 Tax=Malus baccata TaxID=106549 RepID=A0A540LAH5_MALBA|nr:hypothetical protein C1H46_030966 [Malus baccata]
MSASNTGRRKSYRILGSQEVLRYRYKIQGPCNSISVWSVDSFENDFPGVSRIAKFFSKTVDALKSSKAAREKNDMAYTWYRSDL